MKIRRVLIEFNSGKANAVDALEQCLALCRPRGLEILLQEKDRAFLIEAGFSGINTCEWVDEASLETADAWFVFGGDGTVLQALASYANLEKPVLGINLGRLGFLLETEIWEMNTALDQLIREEFQIENRLMLDVTITHCGDTTHCLAMNEVAVTRGLSQRMIAVDARVGMTSVDHYIADGVVLSSPTGSTAYSLSAGGPIVDPAVQCFVLCPVCPHSLQSRPIVLSSQEEVTLEINMTEEREGMIVSVDGQAVSAMDNHDRVVIRRAIHNAQLIRFPKERNFYSKLKNKLSQWSL